MKKSDWKIFIGTFIVSFVILLIIFSNLANNLVEPPPIEEPIEIPPPVQKPIKEPEPIPEPEPTSQWISLGTYKLTAYCPCEKCCGYWATIRPLDENGNSIIYTASGAIAEAGTTIGVDPDIIPYGTKVKINDHIYVAQDTGGGIGEKHIDVYHDTHESALQFGLSQAEVFILKEGLN